MTALGDGVPGRDVIDYDRSPIVLIFADGAARREAASREAEALGARIAALLPIDGAAERLKLQLAVDVVIVDVDRHPGVQLENLLEELDAQAGAGRLAALVVVPPALIDLAASRAGHREITLLCNPSPSELKLALALALAARGGGEERPGLNDGSRETLVPRLLQLSREAGRIADALAGISVEAEDAGTLPRGRAAGGGPRADPPIDATHLRAMIRARRLREQFFDAELFADPAWDMLLDLAAARLEGRQVAVSSLCIAAAVPPTTALRWIRTLTEGRIVERVADPHDGRRVFIRLSDGACEAMLAYLTAVQRLAMPA